MAPSAGNQNSQKELNILLVEDDNGDAKAVLRAFRQIRLKNTVTRAIDGVEALDILRGTGGKDKFNAPYVILTDINMPRMNGIELIRELRNDPEHRNAVVFVLTTSGHDKDVTAAYDMHAAGYIIKETAGRDFLQLVGLIDRFWRLVEFPSSGS